MRSSNHPDLRSCSRTTIAVILSLIPMLLATTERRSALAATLAAPSASPSVVLPELDKAELRSALRRVDYSSCAIGAPGKVTLNVEPTGTIGVIRVDGPYLPPTRECVAACFHAVRIRPFAPPGRLVAWDIAP